MSSPVSTSASIRGPAGSLSTGCSGNSEGDDSGSFYTASNTTQGTGADKQEPRASDLERWFTDVII